MGKYVGLGVVVGAFAVGSGCYTKPEDQESPTVGLDDSTSNDGGPGTSADGGPSSGGGPTTAGATDTGPTTQTDTSAGLTGTTDGSGDGSSGSGGLPACADSPVALMLSGPLGQGCGLPWDLDGFEVTLRPPDSPSCSGPTCAAGVSAVAIDLFPAQLFIDLTPLDCVPDRVEVTGNNGGALFYVILHDDAGTEIAGAGATMNGVDETVTVAVPDLGLAAVSIHGCENQMTMVRFL